MSLMKIPTTPTKENPGKQLLIKPGMTAIGIDSDCHERFLYWSDVSGKSILRADYEGQNMESIITEGLGSPEGIAVDWLARNIYWTDSQLDQIVVAKLDGSARKVLINTDLVNPRAIAVDPANGRFFWADWNRAAPKIEVADLDGENRKVFLKEGLGLPNGLTIIHETNQLCFADARFEKIDCVDMNNPSITQTITSEASYPFAITNSGNQLFWTDWEEKGVQAVDITGEKSPQLDLPLGGNGRLYGIVDMRDRCPRGNNRCGSNNGDCPYFCFAKQDQTKVCGCPDGEPSCSRVMS